jgi:hypothetical protein
MLDLVLDITSALYAAFCAFMLAVSAMTPVFPWHVAMFMSAAIAATGAIIGWSWRRAFWRLFSRR